MGVKTALLAFADGDLRPALRGPSPGDPLAAEAAVRRSLPGYDVTRTGAGSLLDYVYPPDDVAYAVALEGAEVVCDRRLVLGRPSELPEHLRKLGAGRRILLHGMYSGTDWLGFGVWEDGDLIRSLSVSPDGGIEENIGAPYDFERPYWSGEHPVTPMPGWPDRGPYPLPFHPLELGGAALRALFGFTLEGRRQPDDTDPFSIRLHEFSVTDPTGREQAERAAMYERARGAMRVRTSLVLGPDGAWVPSERAW
jgi:hypothetical protein